MKIPEISASEELAARYPDVAVRIGEMSLWRLIEYRVQAEEQWLREGGTLRGETYDIRVLIESRLKERVALLEGRGTFDA